jgi:hypothetical protein
MTSVQTTYSAAIGKAYPGLQADNNPVRSVSLISESSVIPFGRAVQQGTDEDQAKLGTGTTAYLGITMRVHNEENVAVGTESAQYTEKEPMAVMQEGSIFVTLITTGTKGADIYSVDADGTIGAGTAVAGQTQIPGAKLEETVAATGQVVKIRLKSE